MQKSDSTVNQDLIIRSQVTQVSTLELNRSGARAKMSMPNLPFAIKEIEVFYLLPVESTPR